MTTATRSLEDLLGQVFERACDVDDPDLRTRRGEEFVFHMTDWRDDLQRLAQLYEDPESADEEQAKDVVIAMLCHALGHLIAAARLYDYVPDPFGGATVSPESSQDPDT